MSADNKKGFSGLGDLLSDVQLEKAVPQEEKGSDAHPKPTSSISGGNTSQPERSWWGAVMLIVACVGAYILFNNSTPQSPTSPTTPPQQTSSSVASSPTVNASNTQEEIPPVGTGLVLNHGQILYCRSEKIRLEGIEGNINKSADNEIAMYNAKIEDYNSRCGSFRYPEGMLQAVQSQVDANRDTLYLEGSEKLTLWRDGNIPQNQQQPSAEDQANKNAVICSHRDDYAEGTLSYTVASQACDAIAGQDGVQQNRQAKQPFDALLGNLVAPSPTHTPELIKEASEFFNAFKAGYMNGPNVDCKNYADQDVCETAKMRRVRANSGAEPIEAEEQMEKDYGPKEWLDAYDKAYATHYNEGCGNMRAPSVDGCWAGSKAWQHAENGTAGTAADLVSDTQPILFSKNIRDLQAGSEAKDGMDVEYSRSPSFTNLEDTQITFHDAADVVAKAYHLTSFDLKDTQIKNNEKDRNNSFLFFNTHGNSYKLSPKANFTFMNNIYLVYDIVAKGQDSSYPDCHACGANVSVIKYHTTSGKYIVDHIFENIAELGSWGESGAVYPVTFEGSAAGFVVVDGTTHQGVNETWRNVFRISDAAIFEIQGLALHKEDAPISTNVHDSDQVNINTVSRSPDPAVNISQGNNDIPAKTTKIALHYGDNENKIENDTGLLIRKIDKNGAQLPLIGDYDIGQTYIISFKGKKIIEDRSVSVHFSDEEILDGKKVVLVGFYDGGNSCNGSFRLISIVNNVASVTADFGNCAAPEITRIAHHELHFSFFDGWGKRLLYIFKDNQLSKQTIDISAPVDPDREKPGYSYLEKYARTGQPSSMENILIDPKLHPDLKIIMKDDFDNLKENLMLSSIAITDGYITATGQAPNEGGSNEAYLAIAIDGSHIYAAILKTSYDANRNPKQTISIYSNKSAADSSVPPTMQDWIANFPNVPVTQINSDDLIIKGSVKDTKDQYQFNR